MFDDGLFDNGLGYDSFGSGEGFDGTSGQDWGGLNTTERFDYLSDALGQMQNQGMNLPDYQLELGHVADNSLMNFGPDNSVTIDPDKLAGSQEPDQYTGSFIEGVDVSDEHDIGEDSPLEDAHAHGSEISFGSLAQCEARCAIEPSEPENYMYKVYK